MRKKTNRPRDGWPLATGLPSRPGRLVRLRGAAEHLPERQQQRPDVLRLNAAAPERSIPPPCCRPLARPAGRSQNQPPGVSHLPAQLSPALEAACHAPCPASGILPAPGLVLLWQSAALIIHLCRKQIQKLLLSFAACNSALPTVPSRAAAPGGTARFGGTPVRPPLRVYLPSGEMGKGK